MIRCSQCSRLTIAPTPTPQEREAVATLRAGMSTITLIPSDGGGCVLLVNGLTIHAESAEMALRNLAHLVAVESGI